jgi:hypothetical protein
METVQLQALIVFAQDKGTLTSTEHRAEWILRKIVAPNIKQK